MQIFQHAYLNFFSFSALVVTVYVFFVALFVFSIKEKSRASWWLMVLFFAMLFFYAPYFFASFFYDTSMAFHRWGTVAFVFLAVWTSTQFMMSFPRLTHPKTAIALGIVQGLVMVGFTVYFCFVTLKAGYTYKWQQHAWDFASDTISEQTGRFIFLNLLVVYAIGIWRSFVLKGYRWTLLGITGSYVVATLIPGITNVLSRSGALDRGTHQTVITLAVITGFFGLATLFINTTRDRTTFMAKIIGISFATFMLMMAPISWFTLQDKEFAYDEIHDRETALLLRGGERSEDMRYVAYLDLGTNEFQFPSGEGVALPDLAEERVEFQFTAMRHRLRGLDGSSAAFDEELEALLADAPREFAGYAGLIRRVNGELDPTLAKRAAAILDYFDQNKRVFLKEYNAIQKIKDEAFRDKLAERMQGIEEKSPLHPFAQAVLAHLDTSAAEGARLKGEVLDYFVAFKAPGARHYRPHPVQGEDPYIGFMKVNMEEGRVYEVGYSYLAYRAFIHEAAIRLLYLLIGAVLIVVVGFRLFFLGALVRPLDDLLNGVRQVNEGDLTVEVPVKVEDEIGFLARSFNSMVTSIRSAQRKLQDYAENLEEKVKERTQELKSSLDRVQQLKTQQDGDYFLTALLTRPLGTNRYESEYIDVDFLVAQKKKFEFRSREAEIGGDLCSAHRLTLKGKNYLVFMNADAMGKSIQGAGGALVLGSVFESMLTRTHLSEAARNVYPERWLKNAFIELHKIFETFDGSMLISIVFGLLEEETGFLYYVNAEHPYSVLYREGKAQFVDEDVLFRKLGTLGIGEGIHVLTHQLQPGDVFICGSDGRDDLLLGMSEEGDRIINEDEQQFLVTVEEANGHLDRIHELLRASGEITDDLSLMRIEFRSPQLTFSANGNAEQMQQTLKSARTQIKQGQYAEALAELDGLGEGLQTHPSVLRERTGALYRMKDYEKAIPHAVRYSEYVPGDTEMLYLISFMYKKLRLLDDAADYAERVRMRNPRNVDNLVHLADIYHGLGITGRAQKMLKRALEIDPESERARRLGEILSGKT